MGRARNCRLPQPAKSEEKIETGRPSQPAEPAASPSQMQMNMPAEAAPSPDAPRPQLNQKPQDSGGREISNMNMPGDESKDARMKQDMPDLRVRY